MGDLGIGEILTLASATLGAGETAAGLVAGSNEQDAMNQALSKSIGQSNTYMKKGDSILNQHIQESTPQVAKQEIGQGTQDAQQKYQALQSAPIATTAGAPSTAPTVGNTVVGDNAGARANILNQAAAPVQGLQDWQAQQWIDQLKAETALKQNNQFAGMDAGLLPVQLQAAQTSSRGLENVGSGLDLLGSLAGLGGLGVGAMKKTPKTTTGAFGGGWDTGNFGSSNSNVVDNTQ